ncbi:LysR family transcriptional regulator [Thalassomonas actiniarum]|uniref:LysR family transcriptional regulator n=1 Tax=Thalassomonas actiniarum TaxID=485447 RepID=A0AAF0C3L9_9GAMM|nr:LysR family transcriptional regulator [Thalassomonas actiniarum]WDD98829.1 LysR family transcriptional regulator [Thalassomonas actiniarum]
MLKTTLEQWRMFRAVVENHGFYQAGNAINKSQSTIHYAVQKLEKSLNVKLIEVVGRKTRLTNAGELLLRQASHVLDEAHKLEAIGQSLTQDSERQLKIAVDEVFPQKILYNILQDLSAQFPLLRIELMETVLTGSLELLESGQVDICISSTSPNYGFSEQLCMIEFIAVAHKDHVLHQSGQPLTFETLKDHHQIVVRDSGEHADYNDGWLGSEQRWTVSHMRTSIDMISNGFGFAWLPVSEIGEQLTQGLLKPLRLGQSSSRLAQLYLLLNEATILGPAGRSFISAVRYHSKQLAQQSGKQLFIPGIEREEKVLQQNIAVELLAETEMMELV